MGEGLAEGRVAVRSIVRGAIVRLVCGAVRRPAEDALAVRRQQLRVDVDRCEASTTRSKCQRSADHRHDHSKKRKNANR